MSEQLKDRTRRFALDVIALTAVVPKRFETQHIIGQWLRASSSVAANYRAAFRGRSRSEFVAKLGIVEEEADESQFWAEMLRDAIALGRVPVSMVISQELSRLIREAEELLRITVASKKTAREKL